jgi:hypothetical protein
MARKDSLDEKTIKMIYGRKYNQTNPLLLATREGLINFYRNQLEKFMSIGIGKQTENNVVVTDVLIDVTIKRLKELQTTLRHKPMGVWG